MIKLQTGYNDIYNYRNSRYFIETVKKYKKIGIMAGASTPKKRIEEVVEILQSVW